MCKLLTIRYNQLSSGASRIGCEHHAHSGQRGVEGAVLEGEVLGIGDLRCQRNSVSFRPSPGLLEQTLHVVRGDHVAAAASRGQSGVAVAGGDVEDLPAGTDVDCLAQVFPHHLQGGADHGVVAR